MGQNHSRRANTAAVEGDSNTVPSGTLTPRFQMTDIGFNQIISALSSNQRVEANDPRWKYLFNPDILLDLLIHPYCISEHALRLIQNNLTTRNLIALIDQINHQLSFLLRSRGNIPEDVVQQTCVSLSLLTNILHYFFMFRKSICCFC
ncbi:MAG: hypothetical protein EOP48_27295 [Sphingobacteriales bacterium]|nr:MAG: hypothetical protein EOP48_27295 [Sphingobacteriales bacterium]